MKVYTIAKVGEASDIETRGFPEPTGTHLTDSPQGILVADRALLSESGLELHEAVCFEIELPDKVLLGREWVEEGHVARRFLVPAAVLNRYLRRRLNLWELLVLAD